MLALEWCQKMQQLWCNFDFQDLAGVFRNMHTGGPRKEKFTHFSDHEGASQGGSPECMWSNEELTHGRQPPHGGL